MSQSRDQRRRSPWLVVLAAPLFGLVAACGSTVQVVGTRTDGMSSSLSADGAAGLTPGADAAEAPGVGGTGGSPASARGGLPGTTGAGRGGSTGGEVTGAATASASTGPGGLGHQGPIKLGVVGTDVAAIAAAFGQPTADIFASPKKVISYINKTGGVGGRQVEATFYKGDSASDNSTNGQAACTYFTQDHKVDIVVSVGLLGDLLPSCLQQRGVALVDDNWWTSDLTDMRQHPNWIFPSAIRLDRSIAAELRQSAARGVLKRGDSLGVLVESCPFGPRVLNGTVLPIAEELGVTVTQGTLTCVHNTVEDIAPVTNDVQRETLRFNAAHVTHVLVISESEAFVVAQFTKNASNQRYYPTYIVSSNAYVWNNSQSDAIVQISSDALPHITGVGTMPLLDIGSGARVASAAQSANQARCRAADPSMQQAGATKGKSGYYFNANTFYDMCDAFYVMKQVLELNSLHFGYAEVARGFASLLSKHGVSSILVGGHYAGSGSNRLDGAGLVQSFAYSTSRRTFEYDGPAVALP